jgi:Arc/MetJ family transcription regulator
MINVQSYVNSMCESVGVMKITDKQKDFVRAAFRAAIEYANAQHGMHASENARAAALSNSPHVGEPK